jgi:hypothetical protein
MRSRGDHGVGRFTVEIEIVNYADLVLQRAGHLHADKVRRQRLAGFVDTGAAKLVLPQAVVKQLGLPPAARSRSALPAGARPRAARRRVLTSS